MRALSFIGVGRPLVLEDRPVPTPGPHEVLLKVEACAVCRTDLHLVEGDLHPPRVPLVPGHEVVGRVVAAGPATQGLVAGARVGVPWLGWTCSACADCRSGRENLCERAEFTGFHRDGGFAEFALADARYVFPLPEEGPAVEQAPLLCAGLIGYRAYRMAGAGSTLGLYGFGAAAHLLVQVAVHQGRRAFAFTRPGDRDGQRFATSLGAVWAGDSTEQAPELLDSALIFAPVGSLVPAALKAVRRGGVVVCAGIHMSDIPTFPYELLWGERVLRSVANLTREDGRAFFELVAGIPLRAEVTRFRLEEGNQALGALKRGEVRGAAVLVP